MADPNYASVVLLAVNNNGANGSTTFADQSPVARTLTASGNAAYSSTTAPTGMTTSMACDGVGDYISSTNSTDFDFGSGDFTVEAMIYFTTQPTALIVCKDDVTNRSWHLAWVSGIGWQFAYFVGGSGTNYRPGTGSVTTGTWYHVAACRSGANLRVFVNGSQVGSTHNIGTNTIDTKTAVQSVGASGAGTFGMNGWISNVRITKGVARYTANFTPPSLPLPTSAVDAPVADFTGTPTSGTTPLSVTFTDSSTNTPTSWLWERTSDGTNWTSFSTSQNPTQAFTTGTWGVRLTATNAGGSGTKTRLAYITVTDPAPTPSATGGGGGGVAKWPGRPDFGWEKWRAKEEKRLKKEREAAEKRVTRLQKQIQKARLELTKQIDLEAIKRLMREIEAIQTRLDRAQQALDELEMEEVMLIWALTR